MRSAVKKTSCRSTQDFGREKPVFEPYPPAVMLQAQPEDVVEAV